MQIYELAITPEESRNYHKLQFQIKALSLSDWIKAYMLSVVYTVFLCFICMMISKDVMLYLWFHVNLISKIAFFLVIFFGSAIQRSRSKQLRAMIQKYLLTNMPKEFVNGNVRLKKIKVQGDRILVFYRKFNE